MSEAAGPPSTDGVADATAFLRRLGAVGSEATVLSLALADPAAGDGAPVGADGGSGWTALVADELAERLGPLIRSTDLLCQIGDGEFLLVVPSGGELTGTALADRVRGVAALPFATTSGDFSLVVRVGVATYVPDREDPSLVVDAARADARGDR